ncbi:MAG: TetR/AcrR family transcriptional regulator [Novosphingobium sp.]
MIESAKGGDANHADKPAGHAMVAPSPLSGHIKSRSRANISERRLLARAECSAEYVVKRKRLFQIAAEHFRRVGFKSARLADIAREAGVDRATIYYYVGSKEELFLGVIENVLDANMADAERLIADPSLNWVQRLHAIYVRMMESYEANYPATFVYIQEQMHPIAQQEPGAHKLMMKTRLFDQMLVRIVREAMMSGELRSDIPHRLAETALFGMLNWTHRWFTPDGDLSGREIAEAFWSIFVRGMALDHQDGRAALNPDPLS